MTEFRDILAATAEKLVQLFYRVKPLGTDDFIAKINHTARQLGVNHPQLVCALGFNKNIRELTDILSVIGFKSYKLLSYRRDEIFSTDTYAGLDVDNILDVYSERLEDPDLLETLRGLLSARLHSIETTIANGADASTIMSYKMEVHAIYAGGIATAGFAQSRAEMEIGHFRAMTDELQMMVGQAMIPPSNLFFLDTLLAEEKRVLLETGQITDPMIRNRVQNIEISAAEREVLEEYL